MEGDQHKQTGNAEHTEAWILGTGTASLTAALYLINHAKVHPTRIHILDKNTLVGESPHNQGNSSSGYDQFAGCLPVPVGSHMKEFLAMIPSVEAEGRSFLDEIQTAEATRLSAKGSDRTCFLAQKNGTMKHLPVKSLNLKFKYRAILTRLLLRREKTLMRRQIRDFFPESFFESLFWVIWSTQYVLDGLVHNSH